MLEGIQGVAAQVGSIVVGKNPQIRLAMACLLARGHLLIEDLPGVGKTTLAHALAISLGLDFKRVQFTNDLLPASEQADGEMQDRTRGDDDFSAVRPYREGDSLRRLAWKVMARSSNDDPLTKSFEGGSGGELAFDWRSLPAGLDVEARLSRLTRWVMQAEAAGQRFALAIPGREIDADSGPPHRAACLEALATFSMPRAPAGDRQ